MIWASSLFSSDLAPRSASNANKKEERRSRALNQWLTLMDIIRMEEWSSVLLAASLDFLSQNTISTAIQHFAQDGSSKKIGLPLHTRLAAFTSKLPVKSGGISEFLPWWLWRPSTTPSCEVLDHQCSWLLLSISSCITQCCHPTLHMRWVFTEHWSPHFTQDWLPSPQSFLWNLQISLNIFLDDCEDLLQHTC
jgi:hypothetical protein